MNDGKPPIVKARKSKLNASNFSSNLYNNSSFARDENFLNNTIEKETPSTIRSSKVRENFFSNFLSYTGSNTDTNTSSQFNNNDELNEEFLENSELNIGFIKHSKNSSSNTNTSETNKRPPITPRKHLNDNSHAQQFFHNVSDEKNQDIRTSKENPFIVKTKVTSKLNDTHLDSSFNDYGNRSSKVLRSVFSHDGKSVDLELNKNLIKLKSTSESQKSKKRMPDLEIDLTKFYSVMPTYSITSSRQSKNQDPTVSQDDFVNGFELHMFESDKPNVYRHKSFLFNHPHRETCIKWINKISDHIPTIQNDREIIILVNPFSGQKYTRSILYQNILPLLRTTQIKYRIIEFHDKLPITDTLLQNNIRLNSYYGILILAGDSSVSKVINSMIELEAIDQENSNICDINEIKNRLRTPLCIIPCGTVNMFANSIYGTNDIVTPLMYLFYGISIRVDLSSVYTNINKLHSFGFGYSCGFGTTLARYLSRYSKLGQNKVQTSLARGIAKQKHRPIEVEIHYLRNPTHQPCDENVCVRGCEVCGNMEKNLNSKKTVDQVEEFDQIANSIEEIKRNISYNNHYDDEWEVIRGSFTHVAFLSNASLWDHAPAGLSKYGHLADGCIDLVLVDKISRKEFYRFIKRHTNRKNQLSLPFVKTLRIKEAKIKILNASSGKTNPMSNSMFTDESLNSFASNSISNDFFKKTKHFYHEPNASSIDKNHNKFNENNNKNFIIENEFSSDPDDFSVEEVQNTNNSKINRIGSFRLNNSNGSSLYYIKNNSKQTVMNASFNQAFDNYEDNDNITESPNNRLNNETMHDQSMRVSLRPKNSLLRKSQSFINLLGLGKNINSLNESTLSKHSRQNDSIYINNQNRASFNGFPGKSVNNFNNSASFKSPSVWNCDWNLNNIPEMHIKCNKQFLPVFAHGIDPYTDYESSSMTLCLPGF